MRRRSVLLVLGLGACARRASLPGAPPDATALPADVSCVPFARALSGIALAGDAHRWWAAAEGRYRRSQRPSPGAVLVFARTRRLPQGHLAVVVREIGAREVSVAHANWGSGVERGRVREDQAVVDVSPRNDWTLVRVWHPPTGMLGVTAFPTHGFILPLVAADPARLAARVPEAARAAAGTL